MNERKLELLVELLREMVELQNIREKKGAAEATPIANTALSTSNTEHI